MGAFHRMLSGALAALLLGFELACGGLEGDLQAPETGAVKLGFMYYIAQGRTNYAAEQGAQLAAAEINAVGGVNGQRIQVLVNGDRPDGAEGLVGTRTLLDQGVVGIVGAPNSALHLAMVQVTAPAGIPLVSYDATSPALTEVRVGGEKVGGVTSFRTAPSDALQGRVLAQKMWSLGVSTVAVIHRDDAYGRGLLGAFKARFEALGGSLLAEVLYAPSKKSGFGSEVQALIAKGVPQGVLMITFEEDGAALTWEFDAASLSPKPTYFAGDGAHDEAFLRNAAPGIVEGMFGTVGSSPNTEAFARFAGRFREALGEDPSPTAANSYDAVYLMALAMAASGQNTAGAIRQNLRGVSGGYRDGGTVVGGGEFQRAAALLKAGLKVDFDGASGKIDLDANGDPTQVTYAWWRIRDGAFENLEIIPAE